MLDMRKKEDREKIRNECGFIASMGHTFITIPINEAKQLLDLADERDHLAEKCEILGRAYQDLENKLLAQIERRMELEEECRALSVHL